MLFISRLDFQRSHGSVGSFPKQRLVVEPSPSAVDLVYIWLVQDTVVSRISAASRAKKLIIEIGAAVPMRRLFVIRGIP